MIEDPMPTLETERLVLRPFRPGDAAEVQRLAGEREIAAGTLTVPHPYPDGAAEEWIATHAANWAERKVLTLAVTTPGDDTLVGAVGLMLTMADRRAELGYWIGIPWWNLGYATEASRAIIDFGFASLGLHRIMAQHMARNPGSGRVMQKLGMQQEGILRQHTLKWGVFEDLVVYAVLAE
ncbi:MAG: GNAT family N-acetyltransferase [Gemmatimonadota bacterium]|jgi:[ribosomal protein S5]-alanine N-acetyltransferase|nr:GNAT family N-acetyltransferase [Gemmatimonadota bacterium]